MAVDIRKPLKKYLPHLLKAREDNLNEADTVLRLIKVFEDVFEYDPMTDISKEAAVKEKFVDVALKVDGTIRLLVEVKSAATTLRDRHIEQAQSYAANSNIRWVLLTNGIAWNLYHLTFEEGIESVPAFAVDLSEEDWADRGADCLALLHRQAIKRGALDDYWQHKVALGPASIGRALFTEEVLKLVRRKIRQKEGLLIDEEDLGAAIHGMLSTEAREQVGRLKIKWKPRARSPKAAVSEPSTAPVQTAGAPPPKPE
jgi:predicted type IV restriction endonuclease